MPIIRQMQIGKNGVTNNFIESLKQQFNNCKIVKITVLRSARENKNDVKKIADEILKRIGNNYTARIVGFTISLKRWKKNQPNNL